MPRSPVILEKQPWEERILDMDFAGQFADEAVTIGSGAFLSPAIVVGTGGSLVISSTAWSGTRLQAVFTGGLAGERYLITGRVTGSNGEKVELEGIFSIVEHGA